MTGRPIVNGIGSQTQRDSASQNQEVINRTKQRHCCSAFFIRFMLPNEVSSAAGEPSPSSKSYGSNKSEAHGEREQSDCVPLVDACESQQHLEKESLPVTTYSKNATTNTTMPTTTTNNNIVGEDCPMCLETMTPGEELLKMPCSCGYNFCSQCLEAFIKSSKDDYEVASDGSRQVKIHIMCPQCRGTYPMEASDLLLLRKAYYLGSTIVDSDGSIISDSLLSSSQLTMKRDFSRSSKKRNVELALGLYKKCMEGIITDDIVLDVENVWGRLFEGIPDLVESCSEDTNTTTDENGSSSPAAAAASRRLELDLTLFKGLEDFMGHDERVYMTQLLTSGDHNKLAQAAMILNGVLRLSSTRSAVLANLSFAQTTKLAEKIEKTKKSYPLPNHMPGYFLLPTFSKRQGFMKFDDMAWDGKIIPPTKSQRTFDMIYGEHYHCPDQPRSVVIIKGVKGPAGRVGLRKGDVVTHINDMEWTGNSEELAEHIYELYDRNPEDEISLTVNATPETATFLKVRCDMMSKDKADLR